MGTTTSKESGSSWQAPNYGMQSPIFSLVQRTQCDSLAPPPLPPPGATPPPPPPDEKKAAPSSSTTSKEAPPPPPPSDSIAEAAAAAGSSIPNPGPYEQASQEARRLVMLDTHDGFRCDINKQLSPYMAVVHSFWLGTSMIPDKRNKTYSFLTQVADETGMLMARVDPERGSVDGRIHRALLGGAVMVKLQLNVSADGQSDQVLADVDFGGMSWTSNLKYGSMGGGLMYGMNYFQTVTPNLAAGGEGMYMAANQILLSNYTLKYSMPAMNSETETKSMDTPSLIVANYNSAQGGTLTLNYKRVVTPNRVSLGAELQCSPVTLDSQVAVGAEFKLTRSKMAVVVDGSGKIQSTLETKLGMGQGPTLNFSAEVDHAKDMMRFGYGLTIDS
jgi:mitochondrial import receptor subunit TOM40